MWWLLVGTVAHGYPHGGGSALRSPDDERVAAGAMTLFVAATGWNSIHGTIVADQDYFRSMWYEWLLSIGAKRDLTGCWPMVAGRQLPFQWVSPCGSW